MKDTPISGGKLREDFSQRVVAKLPLLAGIARRFLKHTHRRQEEPKEVVHDALVKVLKMSTSALRGIRNFTGFMEVAVRNCARDRNYGHARRRIESATILDEQEAPGPAADEEAARGEDLRLLRGLVDELTGRERHLADLLTDPTVEGSEEIRQRLDVSAEALRQMRHRLLEKLHNAHRILSAVRRHRPVDGLFERLVRLRYLRGLAADEVARSMGCNEATVKRWLKALRDELPDDLKDLLR